MKKCNKLINVIEKFRIIDAGMHAQAMVIFLYVAQRSPNPIPMSEIAEHVGVTQASVSRNVALLSSWTRYKTKGPNLVEAYEDANERRRKLVKLTHKGLKFYNDLVESI